MYSAGGNETMRNAALLLLAIALPAHSAWAVLPALNGPKTGIGRATSLLAPSGADIEDYRLGDEWGKKPVTGADLSRATPSFRRAALATAHIFGATGFYLGKFHGAHVMATNHHVLPSDRCSQTTARFPLLGVNAPCESYLGTWDEVDLTLFTVKLTAEEEAKLLPVAGNFRLHEDVAAGKKLLTIGFGRAGNPTSQLMGNQDSDCYVFSQAGEYRLMEDPDKLNPANYRAWSFSLGCDVSHGDSGSAIVDRETSAVVGIIWTGRIPKSRSAQSSVFLTKMFQEKREAVWDELSFAVPAKKIGEKLQQLLNTDSTLPEQTRGIFTEMLR
jgi:hypothetical protein